MPSMSTEIHTLEGSRFGTVRDGSEDVIPMPSAKMNEPADVAKLADAYASGAYGRKALRVQVPPSAPSYCLITVFTYQSSTFQNRCGGSFTGAIRKPCTVCDCA